MRDTLKPYAFVIAGVLLAGLSPVFTKLLLLENLSQSTVVAARYLLAIALLAPLGVPHRRPENAPPPDRRAWITLFLVGAFGSGLGALLFTAAVDLASAGVVNSISKTAPIFVALFVYFTLREQVSYLRFLLVAVMVAAVVLIGAGELTFSRQLISARLLGDGLALAAGMTRAVAEILGKSALRRFTPATVAFWRFGVGFLVTGVVCASTGGYLGLPVLAPRGWLILLALAGVSTSLAMALYYRGLASIPAHVAVSLKLLGVIVTVVVSWIVLGEALTPYHVAGIAVLISGAYLLVLRAARAPADIAELRLSARRPLARLRTRFIGVVIIIVTASVGAVWYLSMRHSARLLEQQVKLTIGEVAAILVEFGGIEQRPSWQSYQQYLDRVVGHRVEGELYALEVVYVAALDPGGNIGAFALSRDIRLVDDSGRPYARGDKPAMARLLAEMAQGAAARRHGIITAEAQLMHTGRTVGTLKMGCAREMQEGMVGEIVGRSAVAVVTVLLAASVAAILAGGGLIEPLEKLAAELRGPVAEPRSAEAPGDGADEVEEIRWAVGQVTERARSHERTLSAVRRALARTIAADIGADPGGVGQATGPREGQRVLLTLDVGSVARTVTPAELGAIIDAFLSAVIGGGGQVGAYQRGRLAAAWGEEGYELDDPLRAALAALEVKRELDRRGAGHGLRMAVEVGEMTTPAVVGGDEEGAAEILISAAALEAAGEHLVTEPVEGREDLRRLVGLRGAAPYGGS